MDRRELFQLLGAAGVVGTVGVSSARASTHGSVIIHSLILHPDASIEKYSPSFLRNSRRQIEPKFQIITQHYCSPINDEVHQCLLYDSGEKNAKLVGVEYLISDRMYRENARDRKEYWHPQYL